VLANKTTALHVALLKELEVAARPLRVRLHPVDARSPQDLESAFKAIAKERPEALIPLDDPLIFCGVGLLRVSEATASECGRLCRDDGGSPAKRSPPDGAHVGFALEPTGLPAHLGNTG
jgi:hypothetical protein